MIGEQWPVRVFDADRPVGGASGFLLTADTLLTCAHVLEGAARPTVRFPARPELGELPVTVAHCGPWRRGGDDKGDVAVLRLAAPVPVPPARFAPRNALDTPRQLAVLGFPVTRDDTGLIALVEPTTTRLMLGGEWVQLQSATGSGVQIAKGYSGAAVTLRDTGEVVGMVTAASDKLSRMLPTAAILRYWDGLHALLPLGPLAKRWHAALRAMLAGIPVEAARDAAARAADDFGPQPDPAVLAAAASAHAVACYIAEGLYPDGAADEVCAVLGRFCRCLGLELPAGMAALLSGTVPAAILGKNSAEPAEDRTDTTVSVEVARSASAPRAMLLSIRLHADARLLSETYRDVVPSVQVRPLVQQLLPRTIAERVPGGRPKLVEFVLPRTWLAKPVDDWTLGQDSVVRIGWRHPVTVRDFARATAPDPDWERDRRWSSLREARRGADVVHWIGCREPVEASRLAAALAHQPRRALVALAMPPQPPANHPALRAAFDSGIPAVLWRRTPCPSGCTGDCAGARFQAHLQDRLEKLDENSASGGLMSLPALLRNLRAEAGEFADESHCGHAVTLLWDPPRRAEPTPPLYVARPHLEQGQERSR